MGSAPSTNGKPAPKPAKRKKQGPWRRLTNNILSRGELIASVAAVVVLLILAAVAGYNAATRWGW